MSRVDPAALRDMEAVLESIRADARLAEWTGFAARLDAMDRIEFHVLNRIDDLRDGTKTRSSELESQRTSAQATYAELDRLNQAVIDGLRAEIRSGRGRGDSLLQAFERFGCLAVGGATDNPGYDPLDSFVHGLLEVGPVPDESIAGDPDRVALQPTPARIIIDLASRAGIARADTFYDVGSGLGHVAVLLHLLTDANVCGVEIEPAYCDYARRCATALKLERVTWLNVDARTVSYKPATVVFMYTPFRGQMLVDVLARLEADTRGRAVRLATYGPCTQTVAGQSWLEPVGSFVKDGLAVFRRAN